MSTVEYRRSPLPGPAALIAIAFIVPALVFLYRWLSGPQVGDWVGYAQLYDDQAGWLSDQSRDAGFMALVGAARKIFGFGGYEAAGAQTARVGDWQAG